MPDLTGRVALITGASRGIGRACALELARRGADVVVNYLTSESGAREVADEIRSLGRQAAIVRADVSEQSDVREMMAFTGREFGRLDILVSNAASGGFRTLSSVTEAQFDAAMNTNAKALLWLVQSGELLLRRSVGTAKVIALSSRGSQHALPLYGLIGASKAALESLIRQYAYELGEAGITFNIVQAGFTETESTRSLTQLMQTPAGGGTMPNVRRRSVTPADVAGAVAYLASPAADRIQGQTLVVDDAAQISRLFSSSTQYSGVHQE